MTTLVGYAIRFNDQANIAGQFIEKFRPGAFRETLASGRTVYAFHHHNPELVLGRTDNGTLRLREDDVGLRSSLDLPDTSLGRDVGKLVERRDIRGLSIGFGVQSADDEVWRRARKLPMREVVRAVLIETSTTAVPAYPRADVSVAGTRSNPVVAAKVKRMRDDLKRRGVAA